MQVIIYKACSEKTSQRFADQVETVIPREDREIYTDLKKYVKALEYPFKHRVITILVVEDDEILSKVVSTGLLDEMTNMILVIPRENETAKSLSYCLHPRFVAHTDESFDKVSMVLMNMMIHMVRGEQEHDKHEYTVGNNI